MAISLQRGQRVTLSKVDAFADGVAVKQVGAETFRLCQQLVDGVVLVDNRAISAAIKDVFNETRSILEPAGAVAVAGAKAYLKQHNVKVCAPWEHEDSAALLLLQDTFEHTVVPFAHSVMICVSMHCTSVMMMHSDGLLVCLDCTQQSTINSMLWSSMWVLLHGLHGGGQQGFRFRVHYIYTIYRVHNSAFLSDICLQMFLIKQSSPWL